MTFSQTLLSFQEYFKDDLLGYLGGSESISMRRESGKANYRAVVAGGYGLKKLLQTKLNLYGKVHTSDCDITITSFRSKKDLYSTYKAFVEKVTRFIHEQERPELFQVTLVDQANQYVQALDYHRFAVIMIKFKGYDFVDIAFTDMKLKMEMIDKSNSLKAGWPLKKLEFYLQELLTLIYLENVTGVYPMLYYKRNFVEGTDPEKGVKDISRAKLVCALTKSKKYVDYCGLLGKMTIGEMAKMSRGDRDEFFKALSKLVEFRKRVTKHLTKQL
jgi:hypothetical protein